MTSGNTSSNTPKPSELAQKILDAMPQAYALAQKNHLPFDIEMMEIDITPFLHLRPTKDEQ